MYCQGNIENCKAAEFQCRCGIMACFVHGHVDESDSEEPCPNECGADECPSGFICDTSLVAEPRIAELEAENAKLRDANTRLHADVEAFEVAVDRLRAALKSLCFDARQVLTLGAPEYQQGFRELQERIEKFEALSRQEGESERKALERKHEGEKIPHNGEDKAVILPA